MLTDYSKPFREIKSDFTIGTSQSSRKQTNAESLSHQLELKTMISEQRLKNAEKCIGNTDGFALNACNE